MVFQVLLCKLVDTLDTDASLVPRDMFMVPMLSQLSAGQLTMLKVRRRAECSLCSCTACFVSMQADEIS